ncbi:MULTISPECIES: hypothetical protein [unclassified Methylobacterium]|uniref:hypothetical protein n=1 Tax=unclassified Methylobacterium TaxID=2615210 RepID=UPI00226AF16B|nr:MULTISPECIES: hypothetical protein [unclassified Methylobacterium]
MAATIKIKRRTSGVAGSPSSLASGEVAYNEASGDLNLYYGAGDNGSGQATSISAIAGFGSAFQAKVSAFRLDQFAAATAPISGVDPTQPAHLATKNYVDGAIQGLSPKASVQYATAGAALSSYTASNGVLTASANGALTVDGGSPSAGQSVLVKDEGNQANNGIYTVTNAGSSSSAWVLTRRGDFNVWSEVPGAFTFVELGSANANSGWLSSSALSGSINSTAITFVQFSSAGVLTPGNGLTKAGSVISVLADTGIAVSSSGVRISASYAGQTSITTLGTVTAGSWNGTAIAPGYGGTGLTAAVSGLLKGNGSTYAPAVPGTDYLTPTSLIDGGTF